MNPVLTADSIAKSYRGQRVLSAASLRAVPGQLRVLLGRNGAGKSTLIKVAAGLIQQDSGVVHVDGRAFLSVRLPTLFDAADHVTWCTSGTTYELGAPAVAERHELFAREYRGPGHHPGGF